MKIWAIIVLITAIGQFILAYFAAMDKIKPNKSSQILYYIMVGLFLLTSSIREFQENTLHNFLLWIINSVPN